MTNTSDTIKLTCVTADNNNKYYNMMKDASGDTFTVEYGRINSTKQVKQYPISKWESIYRQKIAKGYRDVTNLFVDDGIDYLASKADSTASATTAFIMKLRDYARKTVKDNYSISTSAVTSMMIQKAQSEIDILANTMNTMKANSDWNTSTFDRHLIDIYSILPRKMSNVKKFLAADNLGSDPVKSLQEIITREQDVLDALAATVATKDDSKDDSMNVSIFDKLGIEMREKDDDLEKTVKEMLGDISWRYLDCYYVKNLATQKRFDDDLKANGKASHKKTNLFWHGSRNENWLSILQNGMLIRPSGVSTVGAMFGYGVYFADKAKKSFGYTSGSGSYWAHGNSDKAYMALFTVRTGKQKIVTDAERFDLDKLKRLGDYDSIFAKKGRSLYNNEYVIYDPAQCTIHAIVELKG